jgi:hypothetical protein
MSDVTGIELGPNYCVLARATRHGTRTTVSAASTIGPDEWPEDSSERADLLRRIKRHERLPSRARVVQWRAADAGKAAAPHQADLLRSLSDAGFEIESTQTPAQALAELVRDRSLELDHKPVAAIALNTHGALVAIVSDGAVISSRTLQWTLGKPFSGKYSEQLERYVVISQLAPQLQHIIQLARPVYGADVSSIVLCGNLPNLRSLSMLLIEELDMEVETLDSTDILAPGTRDAGQLSEATPALQLAVAASLAGSRPATASSSFARPAIGALAFVLATGWAYAQLSGASRAKPLLPDGVGTVASLPAVPDLPAEATMGRIGQPPPSTAHPPAAAVTPAPVVRAEREDERSSATPTTGMPAPPLPRVDGLMIAGERRLAIVDGIVVSPGDKVGVRTVERIDRDGVTLRDRSGREVLVPVRPRKREPGGS